MKDANKLGSPLRTQCKPPRTPYARWGEGSATRSTVEGDCSVWSSPVRQDCGASSARQAVQGGKLHLWMLGIHRDATSAYVHGAIVARIYATHNPGFLQKTFRLSHTVTCSDNPGSRYPSLSHHTSRSHFIAERQAMRYIRRLIRSKAAREQ